MSGHRSFWELFQEEPRGARKRSSLVSLFTPPAASGTRESVRIGGRVLAVPGPLPCALRFNKDYVYWAMRNMPIREAVKHFMICGAVGSGKTTAIELFLQSIAPRFRAGRKTPEQLIIFDAQRNILPTLAGMGLRPEHENVWILNPFDERCAVWNVADAAQDPAMARYIATLLVPPEPHSTSPFFSTAARDLVVYVIWGLNQRRGSRWTLRDLLCALDSKEHIEGVTACHPRGRRLADSILNDDKHAFGVLSTLTTKLSRFEEVAALWHSRQDGRRFVISDFFRRPGVLVIGFDPVLNESLWPINAILLKAITDEILRGPNSRLPRHWFVFDEFRALEKVDFIHNLLNRGRAKGVSALLALQSTEGIIDVHGEHRTEDLLSACAHKTFLHLGDPKTAEWAEKYFGKIRRTEQVVTESCTDRGDQSTSTQYSLQDRSVLLASYFMSLPFTGPGRPFKAVHDVPWLDRTLITERPFDELNAWRRKPAKNVAEFLPRSNAEDQTLQEWTPNEAELFYPKSPAKPAAPKAAREKPERSLPPRPTPPASRQPDLDDLNPNP